MSTFHKADLVTKVMEGLINGGITPTEFFVGLHNTFYHGAILEENGYVCSGKQLEDLFAHFEALNSIAKKIK